MSSPSDDKPEEETAAPYPNMELAQQIHRVRKNGADPEPVLKTILEDCQNASLYQWLCERLGRNVNASQVQALEKAYADKLETLEAAVVRAQEQAGDMEVLEARVAVARWAAQAGTYEQAQEAYELVLALPKLSSNKKVDVWMEQSRLALFYGKDPQQYLSKCPETLDWDRRNRIGVYKAIQMLWQQRDTKKASALFQDGIATFSCQEICSYQEYVVYTLLTNVLHLERPLLKKLLDSPEVRAVDVPPTVSKLARSLYDCNYQAYLQALVDLEQDVLQTDRYWEPHQAHLLRELFLLAFQQYLESYQSVTLAAMAQAFGVSPTFVEAHAGRWIAAGRLDAKMDQIEGILWTSKSSHTAPYQTVIQKGDHLLNRLQKLARVVDM